MMRWVEPLAILGLAVALLAAAPAPSGRGLVISQARAEIPVPPDPVFAAFLSGLGREARAAGITADVWQRATAGLAPDPTVLRHLEFQPEHVSTTGDYVERRVSDARVSKGREMARGHRELLDALEARFGVPRQVLLAIWGMESNYGAAMGRHDLVRSLATLAYRDPRRARFWRAQLFAAVAILQRGDVAEDALVGSWAGAMGHTQFIPTTYQRHAVDFDGDGRRDIWRSVPDALGSAAAYLAASGWQADEPWGMEVVLPDGFDFAMAGRDRALPLEAWQLIGLARPPRSAWPGAKGAFWLLLPAGADGPAFLVGKSFRAILRYNASRSYALAVGLLSERIAGGDGMAASWPAGDAALGREQRAELQQRLTALGHDTGGVDAIIGDRTRDAIRAFQRTRGLRQDGYPSLRLLERLRGG